MNMFLFTLTVFIMLLCLHILTLNMYSGKQNLYSISRRTKLSYFLLLLYFFVLFLMNVISLQRNWQYKVSPTQRRKTNALILTSSPGIFVLFLLGDLYSVHSYSVYSVYSQSEHMVLLRFLLLLYLYFFTCEWPLL